MSSSDLISSTNENLIKIQSSEIIGSQVCDALKSWDLVAYLFWAYFCKVFGLCDWFLYLKKLRKVCAFSWSTKKICPSDLIDTTNENLITIQSSIIIGTQVCDGVKSWELFAYLFWVYFFKAFGLYVWFLYLKKLRQICATNCSTEKICQTQIWSAPQMKIS